MSRPLPVALLLIISGGFMDAFTYIAYGHVFTNAQSGNVVLFSVYATRLDWVQASRHVPPMLAFFPGIFAARWLDAKKPLGDLYRPDIVVLSIELAILIVLAALDVVLPPGLVTFGIAFASAMQNTSFKSVEGLSYTSVVTTGNLRSTAEALFEGLSRRDAKVLRKARVLGAICAAFAAGAVLGSILTWQFGKAGIVCPIVLLAVSLVACRRDTQPR